jgi:hypothetical protein
MEGNTHFQPHFGRQPEALLLALESLPVVDTDVVRERDGHGIPRCQVHSDQGPGTIGDPYLAAQQRHQVTGRFQPDPVDRRPILPGGLQQHRPVPGERVRMERPEVAATRHLDIVLGKVAVPQDALEEGHLRQVDRGAALEDILPKGIAPSPEALRIALRDAGDGVLAGDHSSGVGLEAVSLQTCSQGVPGGDRAAQDRPCRIGPVYDQRRILQHDRFQYSVVMDIPRQGHLQRVRPETDITEDQGGGTFREQEQPLSFPVGDRAPVGTLHDDVGGRQRSEGARFRYPPLDPAQHLGADRRRRQQTRHDQPQ